MRLKKLFILSAVALLGAIPSTSTAQTWQTVLDYQFVAGKPARGDGIAADPAGHVFTAGTAIDAAGVLQGIALTTDTTKLASGNWSAAWNLSDDTLLNNPYIDPTQYHSDIYDCGYDSKGNLYSVGQLWPDSTGQAFWYVRASSDGGLTWSTVDQYQYSPGQWAWATGFAADSSGNIYVVGAAHSVTVVGSGKKATTQTILHRLVRRSSDGGQSWTVVDDVTNTPAASGANPHIS
jgi:hypothetical protein